MTMSSRRRSPAARAPRASTGRWLTAALALALAACDGGTGPTPRPDPENPVPGISSVDPDTLYQGGDSVTVTVTGTGFTNGAVVRLNGTARLTTYHNPSQVTAVVPAALLNQTGTVALTVVNPAPGGGESGTMTLPVHYRAPVATQLNPAVVLRGSGSFILNVMGSGFSQGSVVRWNGQERATTFLNAGQLIAQIGEADVQAAGQASVTVVTPAPGGGTSAALTVMVQNRMPGMLMLSPATVMEGHGAFTLTVLGMGFSPGSTVRWNGADRPTTFVDQGQLTAQIAAADVQAVNTAAVTVFTPPPGGGTSPPVSFMVTVRPNPVPVAAALSPSVMVAETGTSFTLTGTGFMQGSRVTVGGYQPETTVVSPTELRFALEPENVPNAGFASVYVANPAPGGGSSNPLSLRVDNPAPVLSSLSPATGVVEADSQVVRLTGSGFVRTSEVRVGGVPYPSRRISPTELEIVLRQEHLLYTGNLDISVMNYTPGGGVSAALPFSVQNPVPLLSAATPSTAVAGEDSLVVRLTGSGLSWGTVVHFQGAPRTTYFVNATLVDVVLRAEDVAQAGTFALTAVNPAPGGGTSGAVSLTVTVPAPVLTGLPSYGATAGRPGFPLVVQGTGFMRTSVARWNGTARNTNYISSTRLEMIVTDADVASPGTASITVHTPGGGTSDALQLTVRTAGAATATGMRTLNLPAVDLAYSPGAGRIYASLPASAGARANTVVAIDPATGEITGSASVGSNPGALAISDDGSTLWVALDGSGDVRRLSLPDLTPGLVFSLGGARAEEMHVMPGRPGTVAIALRNTCCSPRHEGVAVYDNGVRRGNASAGHTGSNSIAFGSESLLYGYNNETTEFGFRTMAVNSGGVTVTRVTGGLIDRFYTRIAYAAGRVYSTNGVAIDAARHVRAGTFASGGTTLAISPQLGRVYYVDTGAGTLTVHDLNTFQQLGSTALGTLNDDHPALARQRLVRWGADGLALTDGVRIHIFRSALAGP
jgi:hypothetical protein